MYCTSWIAAATTIALALCLQTTTAIDWYDDTKHMTCMKAHNAYFVNDRAIGLSIIMPIVYHMKIETLVKTNEMNVTRQSYRVGESLDNYQQACESAGGLWSVFSGTFDCESQKEDVRIVNTTVIQVNTATCFPPGEECSDYATLADGGMQWNMDMQAAFQNKCTGREGAIDVPLSAIHTTMPEGEPNFVDVSAAFNGQQQSNCMDAFRATISLDSSGDLTDAALHHNLGQMQMDIIQSTPTVITNYEWYPGAEDVGVINYKKLCDESGGRFVTFSGVLDCLGISDRSQGDKTTTVYDQAATCFPAADACKEYTLSQWKVDTQMKYTSCTVRGDDSSRVPSSAAAAVDLPPTSDATTPSPPSTTTNTDGIVTSTTATASETTDNNSTNFAQLLFGIFMTLVVVTVMAMTLALLLVLHQKKKQQNQMECELSKQATTHFQQHAVDDDGNVDDALVGQVEDGQATKELV